MLRRKIFSKFIPKHKHSIGKNLGEICKVNNDESEEKIFEMFR